VSCNVNFLLRGTI